MRGARILVVDDDDALLHTLERLLRQMGHEPVLVGSGESALEAAAREWFDGVLADVRMPGMSGLELLEQLKRREPGLPVVIMTAHGGIPTAVAAMRAGAADFVCKPFEREEVRACLDRLLARRRFDSVEAAPSASEPEISAASPVMRACLDRVDRAAAAGSRVLIRGESGTGKDLLARRIHGRSDRASGPFVAVNCAAIPESLLESELFGHVAGAFTGAVRDKPGRVDLAQGGTLFLDEIGDLSSSLQAKILRLLEASTYERVGDPRARTSDARIVTATHRDLQAMVADGSFRDDLFYRLDVLTIEVPPLRERPEDVRRLASAFLRELSPRGQVRKVFSEDALELLGRLPWPGNVRQLRNLVERLVVFADAPVITAEDVTKQGGAPSVEHGSDGPKASERPEPGPAGAAGRRRAVERALERSGGNRSQAARLLGVSRRTFYRWLQETGS